MDNKERDWLQRELNDIKKRIDGKPCQEHGEDIAGLKQQIWDTEKLADKLSTTKRDWKAITISVWGLIISALMALLAYTQYVKK